MTRKWLLKKDSWRGPSGRSWKVRDDAATDLQAVWSGNGRLARITLPLQGAVNQPVDLIYHGDIGFYRGSIQAHQLLVLLEVDDEAPRSMRGIFYSFKEAPVTADGGCTDPEPIGIWGAEEREGNEWPEKP